MAETVNSKLSNAVLRQLSFLGRLENGAIKKLVAEMKRTNKSILSLIRSANLPTGTDEFQALSNIQIARLNSLQSEIDALLTGANAYLANTLKNELVDLAEAQVEMLAEVLRKGIPPKASLGLQFNRVPVDQIERLVNTPLGGELYTDRLLRNLGQASSRIKASMVDSLAQGLTIRDASREVQRILQDTLINRAETLVRTEFARVATQANLAAMRQNSDLLSQLIFISALDVKVCAICAGLHGKEYPVDHNFIIPVHPNCRCTWTPKLKDAEELGLGDDVPDEIKDLFDGKAPEMPMNFDDFLRSQSQEFQLENLGQARFDLFQQGVSVGDMATDNRILSIGELQDIAKRI